MNFEEKVKDTFKKQITLLADCAETNKDDAIALSSITESLVKILATLQTLGFRLSSSISKDSDTQ